ncbi:unnamed protein product [Auanema sp. JU1783]|nr:unnamed protein product [Auanema sp. JU1783]
MTDDTHVSSDEEAEVQENAAEIAAQVRKRRLLEMKSKYHGMEMKEEDYAEDEKPTKKSKGVDSGFRSYQPAAEVLGEVKNEVSLTAVENEIVDHLKDTLTVKTVDSVDISNLAPKKIDWDLKRDISKKLEKLEGRTQRAIADLIRERLADGKGDLVSTVNAGV